MQASSNKRRSATLSQLDRLAQLPLRLGKLANEAALQAAIVTAAARLLGAQRVLLVLEADTAAPRIAGSKLPAGESAEGLHKAVTPWLAGAMASGASCLRHGPQGAAPIDQRSCLVAPLLAPQGPLGCLYADIEGTHGRFEESERGLLATVAAQAAAALANLRRATSLESQAAQRAGELAVINSIQKGMAARLDIQGIIDLVGDKLREVFQTGDLGIHWIDWEAMEFSFPYQYVHGKRVYPRPVRHIDLEHPLVVELGAGRPVVMNTPTAAKKWGLYRRPGMDYPLSEVQVPVLGSDGVLCNLVLDNHERENAFGEAEVRLLQTIAADRKSVV